MSSDLKARTVTGAILSISAIILIILPEFFSSGRLVLQAGCLCAVVISAVELGFMNYNSRNRPGLSMVLALICMLPAASIFLFSVFDFFTALNTPHVLISLRLGVAGFLGMVLASAAVVYGGKGRMAVSSEVAQVSFSSVAQIGIGGAALVGIGGSPASSGLLLVLLLTVCLNDIAAYFGGRQFGGPKLAPVISPGKTISGAVSGLLVGVGAGVACLAALPIAELTIAGVLTLTAVVICAQLGDLNKSYLKRLYGVKDSGSILPGHGGVYDRIDGLLMGAPVLCFLAGVIMPLCAAS